MHFLSTKRRYVTRKSAVNKCGLSVVADSSLRNEVDVVVMVTGVSFGVRKGDFHYAHVGVTFVHVLVVIQAELALKAFADKRVLRLGGVPDTACSAKHGMWSVAQSNVWANCNVVHKFVAVAA